MISHLKFFKLDLTNPCFLIHIWDDIIKIIGYLKIKNFIYPSYGYVYKNFELLGECAKILDENINWNGKIIFTMNINENRKMELE